MLLERSDFTIYKKVDILEHEMGYILVPKAPELGKTALGIPRVVPGRSGGNVNLRELTRALPEMNLMIGKYLGTNRSTLGVRVKYYVRFGELSRWERPRQEAVRILRILPPNYAQTMQIILRVRTAQELDSLPANLIYGDIGATIERVYGSEFAELHVICPIDHRAFELVDIMEDCRAKLVNANFAMSAGLRPLYNMWLNGPDFF